QLFLDGLAIGVNTFEMDSATFARLYPEAFDPPPYDPSQPYVGPFAGFPNLCIDILHLRDGRFSLRNPRKEPVRLTSEDILNFNYLDVFNVDIVVRSFSLADEVFHGNIDLMSF
ncbi:hypothetical protein RZS08_40165, partial [Arthrospira platensis SPKY1]|nr:hypothetical protein [Arthrospira platensis SPKY1]